jgi:hypothetical protein
MTACARRTCSCRRWTAAASATRANLPCPPSSGLRSFCIRLETPASCLHAGCTRELQEAQQASHEAALAAWHRQSQRHPHRRAALSLLLRCTIRVIGRWTLTTGVACRGTGRRRRSWWSASRWRWRCRCAPPSRTCTTTPAPSCWSPPSWTRVRPLHGLLTAVLHQPCTLGRDGRCPVCNSALCVRQQAGSKLAMSQAGDMHEVSAVKRPPYHPVASTAHELAVLRHTQAGGGGRG